MPLFVHCHFRYTLKHSHFVFLCVLWNINRVNVLYALFSSHAMPVSWCDISFDDVKMEKRLVFIRWNMVNWCDKNLMTPNENSNHVLVSNRSFFTRFNVWRWEKSFIYTFQMYAIWCCNDDKIGAIIWKGFLWEICKKTHIHFEWFKGKKTPLRSIPK